VSHPVGFLKGFPVEVPVTARGTVGKLLHHRGEIVARRKPCVESNLRDGIVCPHKHLLRIFKFLDRDVVSRGDAYLFLELDLET